MKKYFFLPSFIFILMGFLYFAGSVYAATCEFSTTEATNDWNISANWDCGHVPTNADDVVIPAATTTYILADATSSAVTLNSGATLSFGVFGNLYIYGDWINNGASLSGPGGQYFVGSASTTITGITSFNEFIINKTVAGVTLNNDIDVRNNVELKSGNLNTQSNTITLAYSWMNQGGHLMGTGTLECNRANGQTIYDESNLYNLLINQSSATTTLSGYTTATHDVIVQSGMLNIGSANNLSVGGDLKELGGRIYETNYSVELFGSDPSEINVYSLNTLTINKSGGATTTLITDLVINNNVYLENGHFDLDGNSLFLYYGWHAANGTISTSGTVYMIGANSIWGGAVFPNLIIQTSNKTTLYGNATATAAVTMVSGGLDLQNYTLAIGGDFDTGSSSNTLTAEQGTLDFYGTMDADVTLHTLSLGSVNVSKTSGSLSFANIANLVGDLSLSNNASVFADDIYVASTTSLLSGTSIASIDGSLVFVGEVTSTGDIGTTTGHLYFSATTTNNGSIDVGTSGNALFSVSTTNNGTIDVGSGLAKFESYLDNSGTILGGSGTLELHDNWNQTGIFNAGTGTVKFASTTTQTAPLLTYYNLVIDKNNASDVVNLGGSAFVMNDFTLTQGLFNLGSHTMTLSGDWTHAGGTFNAGTGTIRFYGSATQTVGQENDFYNVTMDKISGVVNSAGDFRANNEFNSSGGATWNAGANQFNVTATTTIGAGTVVTSTSGTFNFSGAVTSTGSLGTVLGSMTFNDTYVNNGLFDPGTSGNTITYNATTTNNGTFNQVSATSHIIFNDDFINNGTVNSNGTLEFKKAWTNSGTFNALGSSQVIFSGAIDQNVPADLEMNSLEIDKSGFTATLSGNATATIAFINTAGTYAVGDNIFTASGSYNNNDLVTLGASGVIKHDSESTKITNSSGTELSSLSVPGYFYVTVQDNDHNYNAGVIETLNVSMSANAAAGSDVETITLSETGVDTGVFRNTTSYLATNVGSIVHGDGKITINAAGVGTATYTDDLDASDVNSDTIPLTINAGGGSGAGGGGGGGGGGSLSPVVTTYQTYTIDPDRDSRLAYLEGQGINVHSLVKLPDDGNLDTQEDSAVYYIGVDGKRHAFPNSKIFFTWYANFDGVVVITADQMAGIPLGTNVRYKPGVRMVKFVTDPKVYLVDKRGSLRWVMTQELAEQLYGSDWNTKIDDLSDAFYTNYSFGLDIDSVGGYSIEELILSEDYISDNLGL